MTTVSLKQANKEYIEGHFLSACTWKSSAHSSLKLPSANWRILRNMMLKFDHDQTSNHRVRGKSIGVEKFWSYVSFHGSSWCLWRKNSQNYITASAKTCSRWHKDKRSYGKSWPSHYLGQQAFFSPSSPSRLYPYRVAVLLAPSLTKEWMPSGPVSKPEIPKFGISAGCDHGTTTKQYWRSSYWVNMSFNILLKNE